MTQAVLSAQDPICLAFYECCYNSFHLDLIKLLTKMPKNAKDGDR